MRIFSMDSNNYFKGLSSWLSSDDVANRQLSGFQLPANRLAALKYLELVREVLFHARR